MSAIRANMLDAIGTSNVNIRSKPASAINPLRAIPTVEFNGDWLAKARVKWAGLNPPPNIWNLIQEGASR